MLPPGFRTSENRTTISPFTYVQNTGSGQPPFPLHSTSSPLAKSVGSTLRTHSDSSGSHLRHRDSHQFSPPPPAAARSRPRARLPWAMAHACEPIPCFHTSLQGQWCGWQSDCPSLNVNYSGQPPAQKPVHIY